MSTSSYFDNAATTYPKPVEVYDFADEAYRSMGASIGRGNHHLAKSASMLSSQCKQSLKQLLDCENKEAVFTPSATDALNRILLGLSSKPKAVYMSPFEHNAVTRTLHHIEANNDVRLSFLPFDKETLLLDEEGMVAEFDNCQPDLVVVTHASNVCGAILPVEKICEIAKAYGAITVVDMSQTAGIVPMRLSSELIDFAVFAGHKTLFAPFGIGGFICSQEENRLDPILFGGNGIDSANQLMPIEVTQMVEIGSQNTYAIAGLLASTRWLMKHPEAIEQEHRRTEELLGILRSYENISIVADGMLCPRTGVVSCLFDGYSPSEIGSVLNDLGIAVRTGLHCSPSAHSFLGTMPNGTVRFSISPLTKDDDMSALRDALDHIRKYS